MTNRAITRLYPLEVTAGQEDTDRNAQPTPGPKLQPEQPVVRADSETGGSHPR